MMVEGLTSVRVGVFIILYTGIAYTAELVLTAVPGQTYKYAARGIVILHHCGGLPGTCRNELNAFFAQSA
jgi:hypothetical protein